jgi:heat shock protein HslJ
MRNVALVLLTGLVAACGGAGGPTPDPTVPAEDPAGAWRLEAGTVSGERIPLVDDAPITLVIEGSEMSGVASCNSYGARIAFANGGIELSELGMTAMGCEEARMAAEAAYVRALDAVDALRLEDTDLVLTGREVELRFVRLEGPPTADLVDTAWVLESVFVGDVASAPMGEPATLLIRSDGTLSGSTGCRTFDGTWLERADQILAPILGMNEIECPAELSGQDSHVMGVIGDGFVATLEGDLLTLVDPGGVGLVYRSSE